MRNLLTLAVASILILSSTSFADRRSYRAPKRSAAFQAVAYTMPLSTTPEIKLAVNEQGIATLTLQIATPIGIAPIEKDYRGRFNRRALTVHFEPNEDFTSLQIGLKRERLGYSIYAFNKDISSNTQKKYERIRFERTGLPIQYYTSVSGASSRTYSYARHSYNHTKSGVQLVSKTTRTDGTISDELTSSFLTNTYYLFDSSNMPAGTVVASYTKNNSLDTAPVAGLSYNTIDRETLSRTKASTSDSSEKAYSIYKYFDKLAALKSPTLVNIIMEHVEASYYDDIQKLEYGYFPELTVDYAVERVGYKANLTPLGGRIGYDTFYFANGEVDALTSNENDPADTLIHYPYPAYYTNQVRGLDIGLMHFGLGYLPKENDIGFILLGEEDYVFHSASNFISPSGDTAPTTTIDFHGDLLTVTLGADGLLQIVKD